MPCRWPQKSNRAETNSWQPENIVARISGGFFDDEFAVGNSQQGSSFVNDSFHHHVATPELLHVFKGFFRVLELQIASVVMMSKQECAIIEIVGIFDFNDRNSCRANTLNQGFLYLTPVIFVRDAAYHLVVAAAFILKKIQLADQFLGQIAA